MRLECHANSSLIGHPGVTIINCGIFALGSAPPLQDAYFAKLLGGSTALSGIAGAVLKNVRLAVDRKDDRALVGMRFVKRPDPAPDEFAGPADPFMVVKRTLDNVALLDLGMLVHWQSRARLPFQKARQLAFFLVFVQGLDRDAGELRRLPFDVLRLDVNRTADRGLRAARTARLRNGRHRAAHRRAPVSVLGGGAGEGNRTLVVSLGSFCSAIELHPRPAPMIGKAAGDARPGPARSGATKP